MILKSFPQAVILKKTKPNQKNSLQNSNAAGGSRLGLLLTNRLKNEHGSCRMLNKCGSKPPMFLMR